MGTMVTPVLLLGLSMVLPSAENYKNPNHKPGVKIIGGWFGFLLFWYNIWCNILFCIRNGVLKKII
jgi:hypothetical protein